jgi:glycine cleavage system H protein
MNPATLKYTKTHEWVRMDGGLATIGITDFAVHALTDLVYVGLPDVGRRLERGEVFGEVESVKAVSDVYAPVAGEVTAANTALANDLDALSADPFGKGWLIRLKVSDPSGLSGLLDQAAYQAHCESEQH